jgi:hypothetical protein
VVPDVESVVETADGDEVETGVDGSDAVAELDRLSLAEVL